jgi:hypothetical protein
MYDFYFVFFKSLRPDAVIKIGIFGVVNGAIDFNYNR